ncbi:MAG: TetR/AcrR family transcriptional regulator [Alphaproteobacteria bacterium]|nr:TetR/AcrR family transcriptional regulator [Alphaproteobacteria bacterium]
MLHPLNDGEQGATGLTRFSEQKRRQILEAAGRLFLAQGYEITTMDAIAREAGVSKATVYAHAKNKQELFAAIVRGRSSLVYQAVDATDAAALGAEQALRQFARRFMEVIMAPEAQCMYRIVVAEAPRNPELGRIFFEQGPKVVIGRLSAILAAGRDSGELDIDDTVIAAQEFLGLMQGRFHLPCVLGTLGDLTEADREQAADRVVATFLRAYAARKTNTD